MWSVPWPSTFDHLLHQRPAAWDAPQAGIDAVLVSRGLLGSPGVAISVQEGILG